MGPSKYRGIGSGARGIVNAPPTAPGNGSGGEGTLSVGPLDFGPVVSEIGNVTTGRITLAMLDAVVLGMLAFYWWTHSAQGGG